MRCVLVFLIVIALTTADISCGNGNVCPDHSTCVSNTTGTGCKWGCAPVPAAKICSDTRYSCPPSFQCNTTAQTCTSGAVSIPVMANGYAKQLLKGPSASICSVLNEYLPSFCYCSDAANSLAKIKCPASLFGDTVTVEMDIAPCASPAYGDFLVSDSEFGIKYEVGKVSAGDDESIDIPGLSVSIPGIPVSAGVVLDVGIDGNVASLKLNVGLDACAQIPVWGKECGSDLTSSLPIELLQHTFSFNGICTGLKAQANATVFLHA